MCVCIVYAWFPRSRVHAGVGQALKSELSRLARANADKEASLEELEARLQRRNEDNALLEVRPRPSLRARAR